MIVNSPLSPGEIKEKFDEATPSSPSLVTRLDRGDRAKRHPDAGAKNAVLIGERRPLVGGQIYTCAAGTSCPGNPLASYTDSTAATANTNPVILDAGGFANIWLANTQAYKIVAQDVNGVAQWTVDNVQSPGLLVSNALTLTGNGSVGGTLAVTGASTLSSLTATNGNFSGTLGATGATTLGSKAQAWGCAVG